MSAEFLNKLSPVQWFIFIAVFLLLSIAANVLLYNSNSRLQASVTSYEEYVSTLDKAEEERQQQTAVQSTRLQQMGGQQQELMVLVTELQDELANLQSSYQNSLKTAEQTFEQLRIAAEQKNQLGNTIEQQKTLLGKASQTISSQQRLIKQLSSNAPSGKQRAEDIQQFLLALNATLSGEYSEVTITESSNQTVSIDIPNTLLFVNGDVKFLPSAQTLLNQLSTALLPLNEVEFDVVGHSDARPIVSDLRFRFPNNWALSSARASLVVSDLVDNGLSEQTLTASGKSANAPIRDGANPEAWEVNRRVEIIIHF